MSSDFSIAPEEEGRQQVRGGRYALMRKSPKEARTADGIVFDSKLECEVYREMVKHVAHTGWRRQVRFKIAARGELRSVTGDMVKLEAREVRMDFVVARHGEGFGGDLGLPEPPKMHDSASACEVCARSALIDVKAYPTPEHLIKARWFADVYGAPITYIGSPKAMRELLRKLGYCVPEEKAGRKKAQKLPVPAVDA